MKKRVKGIIIGIVIGVLLVLAGFVTVATLKNENSHNDTKNTLDEKALAPTVADEKAPAPTVADEKADALTVADEKADASVALNDIDEEMVEAFLKGEKSFVEFESKKTATLFTLFEANDRYRGKPYEYAIADLDQDGDREFLVGYSHDGETAIIDMKNGVCTAYDIPYRGRVHLKTDGTMNGSNGAATGSCHRVAFSENGLEYIDIVEWDGTDNIFTINGVAVSEEECDAELQKQSQKENVLWTQIAQ